MHTARPLHLAHPCTALDTVWTSLPTSHVSLPAVKHCVKLRSSRAYREACGRTLVVGAIPLAELIDSAAAATEQGGSQGQPVVVNTLFVVRDAELPAGLPCANVLRVSQAVLAKLAGVQSAAGAL
jgi:hypothetical protein